jgi:general secretion pathway protein J
MMRAREVGFTLIEMLVGLALLGLLTLVLFSALRFGSQSWERAEGKSLQVVDLAIMESMLRRELGKAFPLRVGLASENKIAFEGDEHGVRFLAALPAHFSTGGLSLVELRFEAGGDLTESKPGRLSIRHALQNGLETDFTADQKPQESTLISGLVAAEFAYFGWASDQGEPKWNSSWSQNGRFPMLVRVKLQLANGERELTIPLRLGEEAGCYQASFHRVCGPRR